MPGRTESLFSQERIKTPKATGSHWSRRGCLLGRLRRCRLGAHEARELDAAVAAGAAELDTLLRETQRRGALDEITRCRYFWIDLGMS